MVVFEAAKDDLQDSHTHTVARVQRLKYDLMIDSKNILSREDQLGPPRVVDLQAKLKLFCGRTVAPMDGPWT